MLTIGSLKLDFPVVQAALSGYSDLAMRRVARMHGALYTLSEVVLDSIVITPGKKQRQISRLTDDDHPLGGQLMGSQPDDLARAADALVNAGYDCVDLNFGCPVRKVLGRQRGGFLLSQPETALQILRNVYQAVAGRKPVTVKMRRGTDDSKTSERNFFTILDGIYQIGVDAVTLHPRTVEQRYVGPSDWNFLKRVKKHVGDKVLLGSGDLFCAQDCLRMMEQTGVDGVTAARGCIGNPWIFDDCRQLLAGKPLPDPPTVADQGKTITQHFTWLAEVHGQNRAGRIIRKFGIKYSELHPFTRRVRDAFIKIKNIDELQSVLAEWYDPGKDWPDTTRPTGPGDLIAAGALPDQD
ncbi:MAG: tRNA dihydrouridine synthase [Planctomycetota bacterium]|jgi:nifR3 family TIM-barrel protein